jgi:hypothetical protein
MTDDRRPTEKSNFMTRKTIPQPADLKRWKQLYEGSLMNLNGGAIPPSQQPIFRPRHERFNMQGPGSSKAAIAAAAASLAALWQISKRPHGSE